MNCVAIRTFMRIMVYVIYTHFVEKGRLFKLSYWSVPYYTFWFRKAKIDEAYMIIFIGNDVTQILGNLWEIHKNQERF